MNSSQIQKVSVLKENNLHNKKILFLTLNEIDNLYITMTKEENKWYAENAFHYFSSDDMCPFCQEKSYGTDTCGAIGKDVQGFVSSIFQDKRFRLALSFAFDHGQ